VHPSLTLGFVVPTLEGPQTGGTIYNRRLITALHALGTRCIVSSVDAAMTTRWNDAECVWVDSLYMEAVPALRRRLHGSVKTGLLLHALPSQVAQPDAPHHEVTPSEARALAAADVTVVPSATFASFVRSRSPHAQLHVVEPGIEVFSESPSPRCERLAVVAQHVVPNKQLFEWLRALAPKLLPNDDFRIDVLGRLDLAPEHAERCLSLVRAHPQLDRLVRFVGGTTQADVHARMLRSELVISTSPFETFNMSLAEARALGVPLLARRGGHSQAHVEARAGGALAQDHEELSRLSIRWMRSPRMLSEKRRLAQANKPIPRDWIDAARELLEALS
jgi:glycosyltransferase involved in cell wall biosynthesis